MWRALYRIYIKLFEPDLWEAIKVLSENGLQACVYSPTFCANTAEVWRAIEIARNASLVICTNNGALIGNLRRPIYAEPVRQKPQLTLVASNGKRCDGARNL